MSSSLSLQRFILIFGTLFVLFSGFYYITKTPYFLLAPSKLSLGITLDLLITSPFIFYLLIRKTSIPKTTIVPIAIVGLTLGTFILPVENQFYLQLFKIWILPVLEVAIAGFAIYKVHQVIKDLRKRGHYSDSFIILKSALNEIIPKKIAVLLATEIAVIYFGFLHWRKVEPGSREFSYHKESGTPALFAALIFIIIVESFITHLLLVRWNETLAWIFTLLSLYTIIQLIGFTKSMTKRFISIQGNFLHLKYGIMAEAEIPLTNIEQVIITSLDFKSGNENQKLSLLGNLESHNIIIKLNQESTLEKLYSTNKKFKNIALFVDKKEAFKNEIELRLKK
jgi:hypothetical protein